MSTIDYVTGGRTGDTIHVLYVIYARYKETGKKGNLWLTDNLIYGGDKYLKGAQFLLDEIKNILEEQEYINICGVLPGVLPNDFIKPLINLNGWRRSPYIWKTNWVDMLAGQFNVPVYAEPWLKIKTINPELVDKILINRCLDRYVDNFPWENILKNNQCIFITCDRRQYDEFPYKHLVLLYLVDNYADLMIAINSCKFFIGNQSSPMACAYALHKPCLVELFTESFYKELTKYHPNYFWITCSDKSINGMDQYLTIE